MSDIKKGEEEVNFLPLSKGRKFLAYLTALVILIIFLNTLLPVIAEYLTIGSKKLNLIENNEEIEKWDIYSIIGMLYLTFRIIKLLTIIWRKNKRIEIGTGVTSFPNPFFDPTYEKDQGDLQRKYNELVVDFNHKFKLLKESDEVQRELQESVSELYNRIRIMMRHANNSNRVIRSINYALYKKNKHTKEECLKIVLEECITILEKDQSDKSITLFKVRGDELIVASSVRINFESVDKRRFKKGEGFAGDIWAKNEPEIVNDINPSDNRFAGGGIPVTKIGSIMGFPLNVDEETLGVFCLQSEAEDGFINEDLLTVEFYARICTLILLYDKMNLDKSEG
ncbi:GAF domain-containing protein [Planococcus salinarum]|uniref:GAF domain-containing protein n=1 Tax=Planococcus salinarum TaxID=622695 RepID=UPI000E3D1DD6|nr:GAF domain-containing protein [Planococcus salinarum]TAA73137.1 GAF domain-containing protein [Planococcus salinarum]